MGEKTYTKGTIFKMLSNFSSTTLESGRHWIVSYISEKKTLLNLEFSSKPNYKWEQCQGIKKIKNIKVYRPLIYPFWIYLCEFTMEI